MKTYKVKFTRKKELIYSTIIQDAENKNHAVYLALDNLTSKIFLEFGNGMKMKAYKIK